MKFLKSIFKLFLSKKIILYLRGVDSYGSGAFRARRKNKNGKIYFHQGVDIKIKTGEKVYALMSGKFIRKTDPYGNGKYSGLLIVDKQGNTQKYFYVYPVVKINSFIKKGDLIGFSQDISRNRKMINHYHFEVRNRDKKLLNPHKFLEKKYKLV